MESLKPYPAYKDSGVPWLGKVPAHWEVRRLKSLSLVKRGASPRPIGDTRYFDDSGEYAWVRIADVTASNHYLEKATQRLSRLGQSLSVRLQPGALFLSIAGSVGKPIITNIQCCIHDGFVYFPQFRGNVEFLYRVFSCRAPFARLGKLGTQLNLNTDIVGSIYLGWPPESEQTAIVRFLDHADWRIQRYIRAKQKLIALLEEQKQAIIHQAVTGQINVRTGQPYPAYKPSGVEWLGEVPAHWEVKKLRQCGMVVGGMTPSMENRRFWDGSIPWVTPKDMKRETICDSGMKVTEAAVHETSLRLIDPPAVLMVVRGMILARKVPIAWITSPVTINQDMKALMPVLGIEAEFLARALDSAQDAFVPLIDEAGHGTRRLPTERWQVLAVAIPPEDEQRMIVDFLRRSTRNVAAAMDGARGLVTRLHEYRTRLIADVVTGKLDVREAAAALPEVDPLAADDALDDALDTDVA